MNDWINKCHFGDNRIVLRSMIDAGVRIQCAVTSPPYFGLRSYGIGKDNGEIGLEATPAEFVAAMVEVFGLVRELLADDGTLWLNLGSSYARAAETNVPQTKKGGTPFYPKHSKAGSSDGAVGRSDRPGTRNGASGGMNPTQSLLRQRVPACGTHGKESQDFPVADRACHDSCDEHQDVIRTRHADNAHSDLSAEQDASLPSQKDRGSEHRGCAQEPLGALPPFDQASTTQQSFAQHQGASYRPATASASQQEAEITQHFAQASEHSSACTCGTSQMLPPLAVHTKGKESFFSACRRSSCKGIGRCGYCFASLSIASLNVKSKDELNIPHLVAMALQADGWYLRQTIIWSKPNPMPESVTDRCTKAHEYLFLLSKSERYYYDARAIAQPIAESSKERLAQPNLPNQAGSDRVPGKTNGNMKAVGPRFGGNKYGDDDREESRTKSGNEYTGGDGLANRRSVWTVPTVPYSGAHFATFPPALIEPCILAGSRSGDTVLDCFFGSGTTGEVAGNLGRNWIGCEINDQYAPLQQARTAQRGLAL